MIETLLLYSLLCAAMFYLGSRAMITQWLWSKYPPRFAAFMDCSACTGFWWGLTWASVLEVIPRLFKLSTPLWFTPIGPIYVGICMIVLTPIVAGLMQRGLENVGTVSSS